MGKIIEIEKVFKSYDKKKVLENSTFSIEEGKFTTLIGCNGAGKSTTLRLIAGLENCDKGSIKVFGKNPYSFKNKNRTDVFFIHENFEMVYPMTLLEMLAIYREIYPRWSNEFFNQMLKARKISIKKQFSELSRGQKMQFLLMVGLASQPKIMLLDEITAVIDIEGQRYFLEELRRYVKNGGTVVITTNILSELNDYTDHLLLVQETKLLVNAPVEELRKKFYVLKKTEDHPVFSHPESAKIRKDDQGVDLYLIPRHVVDEDTSVFKFKLDVTPRLEDILVLHFHLKEEAFDEELAA